MYGLITFIEIFNECFCGCFWCQKVLFWCLEKIKLRNLNFVMFYAFLNGTVNKTAESDFDVDLLALCLLLTLFCEKWCFVEPSTKRQSDLRGWSQRLPEGVVTKLGEISFFLFPFVTWQRLVFRKVFLGIEVSKIAKRWTENIGKINFCTLSCAMWIKEVKGHTH